MNKADRLQSVIRVLAIAGGGVLLFLSPWILGGLFFLTHEIYGQIDEWRYPTTNVFDSRRWTKPDLKYRYSVLKQVMNHQISVGMPQAEIRNVLGTPDVVTSDGAWNYETKRPGWELIDRNGGGMRIEFSTDRKVSLIEDSRWED
jgi:hypothetical protein